MSRTELLACLPCEEYVQDQYTVRKISEAWWRVLFSNPPAPVKGLGESIRQRRRKFSVLGENGHIERMSAWTHIVAALGFAIYAVVRPFTSLDSRTIAGRLCGINAAVAAAMFGISTIFHIYATNTMLAAAMRQLDHGAIYVSLAMSVTGDIAISTLDFERIPWQTVGDAFFTALLLLCFFTYRRLILPEHATEVSWGSKCMGMFRFQHADFSHASLRASGYFLLMVLPLLIVPAAIANLSMENAVLLITVNAISAVLMIGGVLMDNIFIFPDTLYDAYANPQNPNGAAYCREGVSKLPWWLCCHSQTLGCACISHAWWHVVAVLSTVVVFVGREVVLL